MTRLLDLSEEEFGSTYEPYVPVTTPGPPGAGVTLAPTSPVAQPLYVTQGVTLPGGTQVEANSECTEAELREIQGLMQKHYNEVAAFLKTEPLRYTEAAYADLSRRMTITEAQILRTPCGSIPGLRGTVQTWYATLQERLSAYRKRVLEVRRTPELPNRAFLLAQERLNKQVEEGYKQAGINPEASAFKTPPAGSTLARVAHWLAPKSTEEYVRSLVSKESKGRLLLTEPESREVIEAAYAAGGEAAAKATAMGIGARRGLDALGSKLGRALAGRSTAVDRATTWFNRKALGVAGAVTNTAASVAAQVQPYARTAAGSVGSTLAAQKVDQVLGSDAERARLDAASARAQAALQKPERDRTQADWQAMTTMRRLMDDLLMRGFAVGVRDALDPPSEAAQAVEARVKEALGNSGVFKRLHDAQGQAKNSTAPMNEQVAAGIRGWDAAKDARTVIIQAAAQAAQELALNKTAPQMQVETAARQQAAQLAQVQGDIARIERQMPAARREGREYELEVQLSSLLNRQRQLQGGSR